MSTNQNPRLLDEVRNVIRLKRYALSTERNYCSWIIQFVKYHKLSSKTSLMVDGENKIESFLTYLAVEKGVASATQNQAMNALVFLYKQVLEQPLDKKIDAIRSAKKQSVPVVLTQQEVKQTLALLEGVSQLIVKLLYGSGLRITEAVRLRVQDIDFDYKQVTVRSGKGNKDRVTTFSDKLTSLFKNHLEKVKIIHQKDLSHGFGQVYLPHLLAKKYPNADTDWNWQYVFPARNLSVDPRTKIKRRHHIDQSVVNKAIKRAVRTLSISKKVSAHTFRHNPEYRIMSSCCQ